ncbi:hypothetical protein CHUAL_011561 [Chamberlinius hualienensis]
MSTTTTTYTQVIPSGGEAQKLLAKIQRTHLSYLQLDFNDSQKLKARWELEDLISSHLSTVPHKEKFPCPRFLEILRRTIEDKVDFNASSAAKAFDILQSYAENLISQPWRREFRCLKLYNGFYKHNLESRLSCSEDVFDMMGYEEGELMEMNLEGPVDPDRVIDVSLNCLIAVVECKIMSEVLDKLSESSWQEIASVRRHNICGVAKTIQIITRNNSKKSRLYYSGAGSLEEKSKDGRSTWVNPPTKPTSRYVKVEKLVADDLMDPDGRYPSSSYYYGSKWEEKPNVGTTNGHYGHSPMYDDDFFVPKTTDEHINMQNLCVNDSNPSSRGYNKYTVPSFQMHHLPPEVGPRNDSWGYIERMQSQPTQYQHPSSNDCWKKIYFQDYMQQQVPFRSTKHNQQQQQSVEDIYRSVLCRRTFPPKLYSTFTDPMDQFNQFAPLSQPPQPTHPSSYLYFSRPANSFLPEHIYRTNVTCPTAVNSDVLPTLKTPSMSIPIPRHRPSYSNKSDGVDEVDEVKLRNKSNRDDNNVNRRSWYDNVDSTESQADGGRRLPNNVDVLPPPTQFQNEPPTAASSAEILVHNSSSSSSSSSRHRRWPSDGSAIIKSDKNKFISSASFDGGKMNSDGSVGVGLLSSKEEIKVKNVLNGNSSSWSCLTCTYLNPSDAKICEMCSRSRKPGAENDPLTSGGHECQKCTLVNEKGADKCIACGHSLENSPTYV